MALDEAKLFADVEVNIDDLNSEFVKQAGLAAYYGAQASKASWTFGMAKLKRDATYAKALQRAREAAIAAKEKVVETALARAADIDPHYIQACYEVVTAESQLVLANHAVDALRQKRDSLVQLGKGQLEERKGEMRMSAVENESRIMRGYTHDGIGGNA